MKVSKWVDMGQEVDIEIGVDDIRGALGEAFAQVTRDRLGEPGPNVAEIKFALNSMAEFLRAVTDRHIDMLTHEQRKMIENFLAAQASRYAPRGLGTVVNGDSKSRSERESGVPLKPLVAKPAAPAGSKEGE